jgi:hypothetical protein
MTIEFKNLKALMNKMQDEKVCRAHMEEFTLGWKSCLPILWKG